MLLLTWQFTSAAAVDKQRLKTSPPPQKKGSSMRNKGGKRRRRSHSSITTFCFSLFTRVPCTPLPHPRLLFLSLCFSHPSCLPSFWLSSSCYFFFPAPTDWGDLPHTAGGPHQGAAGFDARCQEEGALSLPRASPTTMGRLLRLPSLSLGHEGQAAWRRPLF